MQQLEGEYYFAVGQTCHVQIFEPPRLFARSHITNGPIDVI